MKNETLPKTFCLSDFRPEQLLKKRVLVRVDFNVPCNDQGEITDESRLKASLPTVQFLLKAGAKVILCSHFGRPKGKEQKYSLSKVAEAFSKLLGQPVIFVPDCRGEVAKTATDHLEGGQVCLLENLRFYSEEEKNDPAMAKELAAMAELFVNDAFGAAHRAHASTTGVNAFLPLSVAGFLMEAELKGLSKVIENPERPLTSIIGGSKVSSKIELLRSLIVLSDVVLVGGGMAFTFLKSQGAEIGKSLCEVDKLPLAQELTAFARERGTALILPQDHRTVREFGDKAEAPQIYPSTSIPADCEGCDIGPKTEADFQKYIAQSRTVLWNGPVGVFEDPRFQSGSRSVAVAMSDLSTKEGGISVIGGGDSAAAIAQFGFHDGDFSHISTGGGASLEFLSGQKLPGVEALSQR